MTDRGRHADVNPYNYHAEPEPGRDRRMRRGCRRPAFDRGIFTDPEGEPAIKNPNPIKATEVRTHARKVRSAAR